jgi:hypothetical protein
MAINHHDGRFCLFLWKDRDGNGNHDNEEFSDIRAELEARARTIIAAGRFKYAWLGVLNAAGDDWDPVAEFQAPA